MPQFNFSTYSSQIFWLLVCFGIFFLYVKFHFLPKLNDILKKRNEEVSSANAEIVLNNKHAKENFAESEATIKKAHSLANKIIADAQAKAQKQEDDILKKIHNEQRKVIEEMLEKQKEDFSKEKMDKIAIECAEIVLKKIGMKPTDYELEKLAN